MRRTQVEAFPPLVHSYLNDRFGKAVCVEVLGGLSDASVRRAVFPGCSIIIKDVTGSREADFYEHTAPELRDYGVPIPEIEAVLRQCGGAWLLLEDIPGPLPRSRWQVDPERVAVLLRLHRVELSDAAIQAAYFRPSWTNPMTWRALGHFSPDARNGLQERLQQAARVASQLFTSDTLISGDPNPGNWGLRHHGGICLFDWARFGRGSPAVDLAISCAGLPDSRMAEAIAASYCGADSSPRILSLAQEIVLAKAWSVVEFLSRFPPSASRLPKVIGYLRSAFPPWLASMSMYVSRGSAWRGEPTL